MPPIDLTNDERLLLCAALNVYLDHIRSHAAEDGYQSHSEQSVRQAETRLLRLLHRLTVGTPD